MWNQRNEKRRRALLLLALLLILPSVARAQLKLRHKEPGPVGLFNPWSDKSIALCPPIPAREFQAYRYVPGIFQGYFRFSWTLYRNGQNAGSFSSIWDLRGNSFLQNYTFQNTFFNVIPQSGTYDVRLLVERRSGFIIYNWNTVISETSNSITATTTMPTHSFIIKSASGAFVPPHPSGSPIKVSLGSGVIMDASASSCEPSYLIIVEESNIAWDRTLKNEWNRWFNGGAPNNLDLQNLTTTYSISDGTGYFSLLGGNFTSPPFQGQKRYYRIGLQAGGAPWNPMFALIEVDW